jgi:hypothetical protein
VIRANLIALVGIRLAEDPKVGKVYSTETIAVIAEATLRHMLDILDEDAKAAAGSGGVG